MTLRFQGDERNDEVSHENRKDCSKPVIVRPEFAPEADIKNILTRYGAIPTRSRPPQYTETDFDADLTTALGKIERAQKAFDALPARERQYYGTPAALWKAYLSNNLRPDENESLTNTDTHPIIPIPTTTEP